MYPQQPTAPESYNTSSSSGKKNLGVTIILIVLLLAALAFGGWAFMQMQNYKDVSQKKINAAVAVAVTQAKQAQQAADAEANKAPYKTYAGSPTYGTVNFNYPKTWSAYVDTTNTSEPINGYFHPGEVPALQGKTAFALRVELVNQDYSQVLTGYDSYVKQGTVTAAAYMPPKMKGAANLQPGTLLKGKINLSDQTQNGQMLVIKVRDKTLKVYSDSNDYANDFNAIVLSSLTFVP